MRMKHQLKDCVKSHLNVLSLTLTSTALMVPRMDAVSPWTSHMWALCLRIMVHFRKTRWKWNSHWNISIMDFMSCYRSWESGTSWLVREFHLWVSSRLTQNICKPQVPESLIQSDSGEWASEVLCVCLHWPARFITCICGCYDYVKRFSFWDDRCPAINIILCFPFMKIPNWLFNSVDW